MENSTILLLTQKKDYSNHSLAKYVDGNLWQSTVMDINYHAPLRRLFTNVIVYDCTDGILRVGFRKMNKEIINLVKMEHPKYVLWMRNMFELFPETLKRIRKEGSFVIGLFVDDDYRFAYYSKWWVPYVDYIITFDLEAIPRYKELGAKVIHAFPCEGIPQHLSPVEILTQVFDGIDNLERVKRNTRSR